MKILRGATKKKTEKEGRGPNHLIEKGASTRVAGTRGAAGIIGKIKTSGGIEPADNQC